MSKFERSMGCREIRSEIEDAGHDQPLSFEASAHMRRCGQCEIFFEQQLKLRQIVASLGTVVAPNDFEFRLRARLAGEKRSPATTGKFSFSLRAAAFASVVLLVGVIMLAVGWRPAMNGSGEVAQGDSKSAVAQPAASGSTSELTAGNGSKTAIDSVSTHFVNPTGTTQHANGRNPSRRAELKTASNRAASRDLGKSSAKVVKIDELVAADGHTVFPIDAAPQSVKVSLDNGRGTPKTISVPGVSFGSQRTLSQNSSPLMASSRGAW